MVSHAEKKMHEKKAEAKHPHKGKSEAAAKTKVIHHHHHHKEGKKK